MTLKSDALEVRVADSPFGLSARRIHEHVTALQINPFDRATSSVTSMRDAAALVDLVRFYPEGFLLTGLTAGSVNDPRANFRVPGATRDDLRRIASCLRARRLIAHVWESATEHGKRRAVRAAPPAFLSVASPGSVFGVPGLHSRLCEYLEARAAVSARVEQWRGTLRNLRNQGIRQEEWDRSGLGELIDEDGMSKGPLSGAQLRAKVDFSALQISVVPNIVEARTQLRFEAARDRPVRKIKGEPRPQLGQRRWLRAFDRALGYRIEELEHETLWGPERHWQAVTFEGRVLRSRSSRRAIFDSAQEAIARAQEHAREVLPKLLGSERWVDWCWTGGENYREWLITLPRFPGTFMSGHFSLRNILAHVRCDLREGADGESVLLIHELQSDWMQSMRRRLQSADGAPLSVDLAPFLKEWPALTLKLMLLHAAHIGAEALTWTYGRHQEQRYQGLGREGLKTLYDRTLPREADHLLRPYGLRCEDVQVYVPNNFRIRPVEAGYEVRDARDRVLGVAQSFHDARRLMPDGAHEELHTVHGVRLDAASRQEMLERGFMAWG